MVLLWLEVVPIVAAVGRVLGDWVLWPCAVDVRQVLRCLVVLLVVALCVLSSIRSTGFWAATSPIVRAMDALA